MQTHNNLRAYLWPALFGLMVAFLTTACEGDTILSQSQELPANGWARKSPVVFNFDIQDTARTYRLDFSIRHDHEYPFMNAFFLIYTYFPNQDMAIDTLECILADYRGQWTGEGVGHYKSADFVLKPNLRFPQAGHYRMEVKQALRMDTVKHIHRIGLHLYAN